MTNTNQPAARRSITHHCSECGEQVEGAEACADHPDAMVDSIATLLASDGAQLGVGAHVEGGRPGTDAYDTGVVYEVVGDSAWVGWDSGVRTLAHASELRGLTR